MTAETVPQKVDVSNSELINVLATLVAGKDVQMALVGDGQHQMAVRKKRADERNEPYDIVFDAERLVTPTGDVSDMITVADQPVEILVR